MPEAELIELTRGIAQEWIWMVLALIGGLMLKDVATNVAQGAMLYFFNKDYTVGDIVIIDDNQAVIVRIGFLTTVFQVKTKRGIVWQYVPNSRLAFIGIKKVIIPTHKTDMDKLSTKVNEPPQT